MKRFLVTLSLLYINTAIFAQDAATVHQNALKFMQTNDLDNAVLVLNKGLETYKDNMDLKKDLVLAYYYKKEYNKALDLIKPMIESDDCDVQCYQLGGNVYQALGQQKEAEKNYKEGIKSFPNSGQLYNEYGLLLEELKNPEGAIEMWEKGMRVAPSYADNYYNAATYYYKQPEDKIWAILYGEIYANMQSRNPKTTTIKKMVLDSYLQKLFVSDDLEKTAANTKNEFVKAVILTFAKQKGITASGITPETLAMIRTRFVLDWFNTYADKFPYKLFDYHRQLMQGGLFDSYNQWMFGPVANQDDFVKWAEAHKTEFDKFTEFHSMRIFKMPVNQVYSAGK